MTVIISPELGARIDKAYYVWFTTVRSDGMPQPTPVWFIREGETFLIYSQPNAQKIANIAANNKVALSFADSHDAEAFFVIMGEATVDHAPVKANENPIYQQKYAQGIVDIKMTPESMAAMFSSLIRVTPIRVREQ